MNISKAGNIDSLVYDAENGVVSSASAMGISFVLTFSSCMINGKDWKESLGESTINSLKTGAGVEISYVIASQLARTSAINIFKPTADKLALVLGKDTREALVDAFGQTEQVATKNAVTNILQSNLLFSAVTIVVFTVPDVIDMFSGRISAKQMGIDLAVLLAGTAGGTVGMIAGSQLLGGPWGTVAGGMVVGTISALAANTLLTTVFETDMEEMYDIITKQFAAESEKYLVSDTEANEITDSLSKSLSPNAIKDMYESKDREQFANDLIETAFENEISKREEIVVPTEEEVRAEMMSSMDGIVFVH